MFQAIKDYAANFKTRFLAAPTNDKGMMIGGVTGAIYSSIRAYFTPVQLNMPLAGNILFKSSTRFICGALLGGMVGSTFGNRYGQIIDKFTEKPKEGEEEKELDNQTFMMKTMPFIFAIAANALIICYPIPGGNPIFGVIRILSTTELHVLTTLNGLYVGGTIGHRGGKFIDYVTDNELIADLGLTRVYRFFAAPPGYQKPGVTANLDSNRATV